jgi:hypothetical protein
VKNLEVLANGDLRGLELFGQICYEDPSVMLHHIQDGAPALLVEHIISYTCEHGFPSAGIRFLLIQYDFVLFHGK